MIDLSSIFTSKFDLLNLWIHLFFHWKNDVKKKSLFEVKIDFGCDVDANLAPFWRDFGRPGGVWAPLGASWGRLGTVFGRLDRVLARFVS